MCGKHHHSRVPWPLKMLGALILIPGFLFLGTWVTWMLWNALMPTLFGLTALTFWQAMGVLVLAKLLFGGHGKPGHGFPRRPTFRDRDAWRDHLRQRFAESAAAETGDHPLADEPDVEEAEPGERPD